MHGITQISLFSATCISSLMASVLGLHLTIAGSRAVRHLREAKSDTQSSQADVHKLELGEPIEREMKGGESHSYEIALTAGQYLNVVVDQRGIDVAVAVIGPDGKQIFEFNSEIRKQGQETVTVVVDVSVSHRLNVRPVDKNAAAGSYEIRIAELRPAAEQDRALHEALRLYDGAVRFRERGQYDSALPLGERALAIREKALGPEHPLVAQSLHNLARAFNAKGDYVKAETLYRRALAIWEEALGPDHPDVARPLNNLAIIYKEKGDYARAEPLYQRALAIWEKTLAAEHPLIAVSLNNLALIYNEKGDYAKAEPLHERALAIREKALGSDHPDVANSLYNLAILYFDTGPLRESRASVPARAGYPRKNTWAGSSSYRCHPKQSCKRLLRCRPLRESRASISARAGYQGKARGPDDPDVAGSLNSLANLYIRKGSYVQGGTPESASAGNR